MNYFAHALHFLDQPYFVAGTAVPDWLSVVDRGVRVRPQRAERLAEDPHAEVACVAKGVLQHIRDDRHFHRGRAFAELSLKLSALVRDALGSGTGLQPAFLGHLLAEVLLDAVLLAEDPERLEAYYRALGGVDALVVEEAVNQMASRPTRRLAAMIRGFCRERILRDYLEDGRLFVRLSQVMLRVKLPPLPDGLCGFLPEARRLVRQRKGDLLEGLPTGGITEVEALRTGERPCATE
jgi:hypothetical protein